MTPPRDIREDLEPDAGDDLVELAERLRASRPLPHPAFRGDLGRRLQARSRRRLAPGRARAVIAAYSASGTLLLAIGALGAAGH